MIDPTVRRADVDDLPQLEFLEAEARAAVADQRGGDRWLTTHPARHGAWSDTVRDHHVAVAHIGEVIVGYLVIVVDGNVAVVADVYVTPKARELGFGDELLAHGIEAAKSSGCGLLEGASLPGDRDTKNLYERAGIKARLITVSTKI